MLFEKKACASWVKSYGVSEVVMGVGDHGQKSNFVTPCGGTNIQIYDGFIKLALDFLVKN